MPKNGSTVFDWFGWVPLGRWEHAHLRYHDLLAVPYQPSRNKCILFAVDIILCKEWEYYMIIYFFISERSSYYSAQAGCAEYSHFRLSLRQAMQQACARHAPRLKNTLFCAGAPGKKACLRGRSPSNSTWIPAWLLIEYKCFWCCSWPYFFHFGAEQGICHVTL